MNLSQHVSRDLIFVLVAVVAIAGTLLAGFQLAANLLGHGRDGVPVVPAFYPAAAAGVRAPAAETYDPGIGGSISLYNEAGKLLKYYDVTGEVTLEGNGDVTFQAQDGRRVRTNGLYIIEGRDR